MKCETSRISVVTRHLLCAIVSTLLLSNCAGINGLTYTTLKGAGRLAPPPGKGMVLVYWEPGIAGSAARFKVWDGDQLIMPEMRRGGFFPHAVAPGSVHFGVGDPPAEALLSGGIVGYWVARKKERLVLNVVGGQTYYVRVNGYMTLSTPEEGEKGIAECRLLERP